MKKISILTPTRERVDICERMIQSVLDTVNHPERMELLFYVDDDDPQLQQYRIMFETQRAFIDVRHFEDEPMSVSKSWNVIAEECTGDILKMGNDDIIYKTRGWDDILDEEVLNYPDDIYVMWFRDGTGPHCTFPIVSRKWYETLGYFTPGIFKFIANDTWIQRIGKTVGRLHPIKNVLNEHQLHEPGGKGIHDATHDRNRMDDRIEKDREFFYSPAGKAMWEDHAKRIFAVMGI